MIKIITIEDDQHLLETLVDQLSQEEEFEVFGAPNLAEGRDMITHHDPCLLYTSPSPRDLSTSRMPSSA